MLRSNGVGAVMPLSVAAVLTICAGAQDLPSIPMVTLGVSASQSGTLGGGEESFRMAVSGSAAAVPASTTAPDPARPLRGPQRITLEQVRQSAKTAINPLQRLNALSIEAAKQHRLGVQADYFPKFNATAWNLHATDFLGRVLAFRGPLLGGLQYPVPILNKDQTVAILSFVQPITPILEIHQAVKVARADERIAMAKARAAAADTARNGEIEETYFQLLIARRQMTSAEWRLGGGESRAVYAAVSDGPARAAMPTQLVEAGKDMDAASSRVRELTASLNRMMGWPEDTELDLEIPDPLVENISLREVTDAPVLPNPAVVEAEETVVKARAATTLSKLAYVPTVAAVAGYAFQNAIPSLLSNFGYGGVMASYTLFDFGKREHAIKEARAQLEMAEIGLQVAKTKSSTELKKSYYELERSRQLSNVAQRMAAPAALLIKANATSENLQMRAARAEMELEMLQADLAHRQAYARLKSLMGEMR